MGIHNLYIFLFLSLVHARSFCPTSYCNKDGLNGLTIQSPFWLQGQQPQNCGLPGFNLSCNSQRNIIVDIPGSGEFYVSAIYYYIKKLTLNDPHNCLPARLLSFNLSSSPFMASSYQNYTFLSCPKGWISSNRIVDCLGTTTSDVLVVEYQADSIQFPRCKEIATVPVPVSSFSDGGFPVDLELRWDAPNCNDCGSEIGAENQSDTLRIIILSFVVAAVSIPALIVSISCCICMARRESPQASDSVTSGRARLSDRTTERLDKSTIETYRKITIGENLCNEEPNDVTCPICLADYAPKDIIRFMPECEHCFHVECIDTWLSMNNKCPVCRTSQTCKHS